MVIFSWAHVCPEWEIFSIFFRGHNNSNSRGAANKKRKNYDLVVRIDCADIFVSAAAEEASDGAGT